MEFVVASRKALGLDLGRKRIGVAVVDGLGLSAQPHGVVARRGGQRDLDAVAELVKTLDVATVVVGLPLDLEGQEGDAARAVRAFVDRLRAVLTVPIELVDERFSTVEAEAVLLAADVSRARRKEVVDKLAAAVILQRWLDGAS